MQLIQILGLTLVLVMVLLFRDEIAGGAGKFFDSMGSEDITLPQDANAPSPESEPTD